jgi:hypothetical protein
MRPMVAMAEVKVNRPANRVVTQFEIERSCLKPKIALTGVMIHAYSWVPNERRGDDLTTIYLQGRYNAAILWYHNGTRGDNY